MTLKEILECGGGGILILLCLVQISPLKINPWSAIARAIGRAINADIIQRMDEQDRKIGNLDKKIDDMREQEEEHNAVECRTRILRFGDEIIRGVVHQKEHFEQVLRDITNYAQYCDEHPKFSNHNTTITTQVIEETYRKRFEMHDI